MSTQEVLNQSTPFVGVNLFETNPPLRDAALVLQASLLARRAAPAVFDAFCASRLAAQTDTFGLLPSSTPFDAILDRALPTP
jgi:hypothetical protein